MKRSSVQRKLRASSGPSPAAPELDAPSLSEETLFPRPATDRKMVVSSLSQQNPKIGKGGKEFNVSGSVAQRNTCCMSNINIILSQLLKK